MHLLAQKICLLPKAVYRSSKQRPLDPFIYVEKNKKQTKTKKKTEKTFHIDTNFPLHFYGPFSSISQYLTQRHKLLLNLYTVPLSLRNLQKSKPRTVRNDYVAGEG